MGVLLDELKMMSAARPAADDHQPSRSEFGHEAALYLAGRYASIEHSGLPELLG
jgi:hypothetical protein